jgi:hypothetical protein
MREQYKIWSIEHSLWWGHKRWGYTSILGNAGVYTKTEAKEICNICNKAVTDECMIPVSMLKEQQHD